MLYTQHPLILERWPEEFSKCQVIVINDLLKDFDDDKTKRLPTPEDIRSSFAGEDPRRRLLNKLDEAVANSQPVVCDIEFIDFSTAGAIAWRNSVVDFFQTLYHIPKYNGLKTVMWGMPYAFDWLFTHEHRIRHGNLASIAKLPSVLANRRRYSAFMREVNSGKGNGWRGIGDCAHVNAFVAYQSPHHQAKWPDQPWKWHQPEEWLPATIKAARKGNRRIAGYTWHESQNYVNDDFPVATQSHTLGACQVMKDMGVDEVYHWARSADTLEDPDAIRNIETVISFFGNKSAQ